MFVVVALFSSRKTFISWKLSAAFANRNAHCAIHIYGWHGNLIKVLVGGFFLHSLCVLFSLDSSNMSKRCENNKINEVKANYGEKLTGMKHEALVLVSRLIIILLNWYIVRCSNVQLLCNACIVFRGPHFLECKRSLEGANLLHIVQ